MNFSLWLRFAARDLRSGLQGFWIFLTCLTLGTAAIAIIGSLSASIERGLNEQGQPLLGGDVEFSLVHREATDKELAFIASNGAVSKVATLVPWPLPLKPQPWLKSRQRMHSIRFTAR